KPQLLQRGSFILSGSRSCSHNTAPNQTMLPNSGVINKECRPIVPNPAACAICFCETMDRHLPVFLSHWLSFVGIGTHTTCFFSISIQKFKAIASIFGVIEFLTLVYGISDLQLSIPTGNRHPKEITDLHVGSTSKG